MSQPFVSHVITSFNHETWIEETVVSAAEQNYDRLQIVVSDDASSDTTPQILKSLSARYPGRVRALLSDTNVGVTQNCNRALAECTGELISFQGGDDVLLPAKFRLQVPAFEDREVTLVGHQVENFLSPDTLPPTPPWTFEPATRKGGAEAFVEFGPVFSSTSMMVRRSAMPTYGFDSRLPMTSDWKFFVDCLATSGRFAMVPQTLARYRVLQSSVTRARTSQHEAEKLKTLALITEQYPSLRAAAVRGLARIRLQQAEEAWQRGERLAALRATIASLRVKPVSTRQMTLLGATLLPSAVVPAIRATLRRIRK